MLFYNVAQAKLRLRKDSQGRTIEETRYYAKREVRGRMTLRQVEDEIVQKTSLAKGDVRNAIASLAEVVNGALLSGLIVDLGDLGSFSVQANGKYVATEEEVNASTIKKPQIRYTPKQEMRRYAQQVAISVHNPKHKEGGASQPEAGSQGGGASRTGNQADAGESPSVLGVRPGHNL